jgi:hypothetical protein
MKSAPHIRSFPLQKTLILRALDWALQARESALEAADRVSALEPGLGMAPDLDRVLAEVVPDLVPMVPESASGLDLASALDLVQQLSGFLRFHFVHLYTFEISLY